MSPERLTTSDLARQPAVPLMAPDGAIEPDARAPVAPAANAPVPAEERTALFTSEAADDLRRQWDGIQTAFVDEPRRAVEQADGLVADAMKRLAESFASEREQLEGQWDRGDQVSTEDLRQVLRRYRSFFHRLLAV